MHSQSFLCNVFQNNKTENNGEVIPLTLLNY